jgi:hypothetical protein
LQTAGLFAMPMGKRRNWTCPKMNWADPSHS